MVFSLEHDIKITKSHQNLLPTQTVLVAHTVQCIQKENKSEQALQMIIGHVVAEFYANKRRQPIKRLL
jgi:hypothetical protein